MVSFKGLHDLLLPNLGIAVEIYDDVWEQHLMGSRFLIPGFLYSHLTVPLMSGLTLPMVFLWYAENMVAALAIFLALVIVCARWSTGAHLHRVPRTSIRGN